METLSIFLMGALIIFYLAIIALGIGSYVVNALGLSRVAAAKGVKNPWLAWIPMANIWVTGATADSIDSERGMKRCWGKSLLGLYIGFYATFIPAYIGIFAFVFSMSLSGNSDAMTGTALVIFAVSYAILFVSVFLAVIAQAFYYICLYKVFEGFVPEKSVKYFVLSMIVPLAMGICLMKCCPKKQEEVLPETTEM